MTYRELDSLAAAIIRLLARRKANAEATESRKYARKRKKAEAEIRSGGSITSPIHVEDIPL